jgi:hypothetical protein
MAAMTLHQKLLSELGKELLERALALTTEKHEKPGCPRISAEAVQKAFDEIEFYRLHEGF